MNLAEFPLSLLSQRVSTGHLTFTKERSLQLPGGTTLQQSWIVTGAPEYGLPQPADEDVLLGLMKIASDQDFVSPQVHFTQRMLLATLQWSAQGWAFRRLEQALARLKTTSILARNAFWNNEVKAYQTKHFGIIDEYELLERQGAASMNRQTSMACNWVLFSRPFFASIQAGYLKPLDLEVYFGLNSSVSKRLFRYLDKKRYQKQRYEIGLKQLASVHLGLSDATCQYPSWIKKELERAHDELQACGFLRSVQYAKAKDGGCKVIYLFKDAAPAPEQLSLPIPKDDTSKLADLLVARGVSPAVARELIAGHPPDFLGVQIEAFDHLSRLSRHSPMRNPGGFLAQAIRNGWNIAPPGFVPRAQREQRQLAEREDQRVREVQQQERVTDEQQLAVLRTSLEPEAMAALREEAYNKAKEQLTTFKVRRDGPMVEAFLNGILRERYLSSGVAISQ